MADIKVLNIDPNFLDPVHSDAEIKQSALGRPDNCECGANHWMHSGMNDEGTRVQCMSCGVTGILKIAVDKNTSRDTE